MDLQASETALLDKIKSLVTDFVIQFLPQQ